MKKYISLLFVTLLAFTSCEEDLVVFDSETGQTLAQFSQSSATLATPEAGASATVKVLVSTSTETERTIVVEVDPSSTATADQYALSNLVIPAGSFEGSFVISSNFNALPEQGSSNLVLNLKDVTNSNNIAIENGVLTVEFFRKCPIVLADFVGTWSGTGQWNSIFGYTSEIETSLNTEGELMMNGIGFQWFQGWWGEVIVTNEAVKVDVDLETGVFVIEDQFYITSTYNGAAQPSYNISATGTFLNPCEKTMEIFPIWNQEGSIYNGENFGGPLFVERVQLD